MHYVFFHIPQNYKELAKGIASGNVTDAAAAVGSLLQLPVAPGAINFSYNGKNKTIELINGEDITIIKKPGLTGVSFSFLLPHTKYPFANYGASGYRSITEILGFLDKLQNSGKPFQFIVSRMQGMKLLQTTNLKVTLESYTIEESAENGLDQMCSVTLKLYKPYSTKVLVVDKNGNAVAQKVRG